MASAYECLVLGGKMKPIFVLWLALIFSPLLGAQNDNLKTIDEIKQWNFPVQRGRVEIDLSSYAHAGRPRNTALSLRLVGAESAVTTREEADLLGRVLQEMPSLGYDPRDLEMITTSSDESELREGINLAVTKSGKWRSCIGRKYCYEAQKVADQFLKSVNAYKEFDDTLEQYHLKRTRVTTDDVACTVPRAASAPRNDTREEIKVSCGGMIDIAIERTSDRKLNPSN